MSQNLSGTAWRARAINGSGYADAHREDARDANRHRQTRRDGEAGLLGRVSHEHRSDDSEVEIQEDGRVQYGDDGQNVGTGFDAGGEEVLLANETRRCQKCVRNQNTRARRSNPRGAGRSCRRSRPVTNHIEAWRPQSVFCEQ